MDTYEKKYNEALARAKDVKNGPSPHDSSVATVEYIFPELRESEDERIRKGLVKLLTIAGEDNIVSATGIEMSSYLAYLEKQKDAFENGRQFGIMQEQARQELEWPDEKQKEQKPAGWSERHIADVFEKVGLAKIVREQGNDALTNAVQSAMIELSKTNPAEWSEDDENELATIISVIEDDKAVAVKQYPKCGVLHSAYDRMLHFLKSLRPQPHWKPSEDEERLINTSIFFLKDFADKGYENAVECIDWLKSKLNGNSC